MSSRRQFARFARIAVRAWRQANARDIGLAAAGVAYFGLLSMIPALTALVALYGVIGDPASVQEQAQALRRIAPAEVANLADEQLTRLVATDANLLAWSGAASLMLALWSAHRGVDGFLRALGRIESDAPQRGMLAETGIALAFTLGAILVALTAFGLLAVAPAVLALAPFAADQEALLELVRWPILLGAMFVFVTAIYRWGPNRAPPRLAAIWPFALIATAVWTAGSIGLSEYARRFGGDAAAYGSLAGAAGVLLWLFLSAYVFLFGGALAAAADASRDPRPRERPRWRPPQGRSQDQGARAASASSAGKNALKAAGR